jgi:hypothetical protein
MIQGASRGLRDSCVLQPTVERPALRALASHDDHVSCCLISLYSHFETRSALGILQQSITCNSSSSSDQLQ